MIETYIVRLYFRNALHVGASSPGIGIEGTDGMIIHSDTLWAALCNNWAIARKVGNISFEDFLGSFEEGNPLFQISSAFPLTSRGEYWLPKPLSEPYPFSSENEDCALMKEDFGKKIKRKKFLPLGSFTDWLSFTNDIDLERISGTDLEKNNVSDTIRPHNTLNRVSMESQIYHSGLTYFDNKQAGVYFLLRADDESVKDAVELLLHLIKETAGIGGNRNIGLGTIHQVDDIEKADDNWNFLDDAADTNAYCTLSLFHPKENENYKKSAVAYNLILRKGWTGSLSVGSPVKRQTAYMFSEGSIFTENPQGHLLDLTPTVMPGNEKYPHPVYRYAYGFAVPIKIQQEGNKQNG